MLRAPGRVLSHRPIGFFLFGSLACWTAIYAQTGFFSLYLKSVGAPADQVGLAWSLGSLGEIPTMIFFPVLARRFGVERLIMLGAGLTVTRQIVNTVFTVPAVLLAFSLLHGAGYAMLLVGGVAFVAHHAPRGTGATAQGLFSGAMANLAAIIANAGRRSAVTVATNMAGRGTDIRTSQTLHINLESLKRGSSFSPPRETKRGPESIVSFESGSIVVAALSVV